MTAVRMGLLAASLVALATPAFAHPGHDAAYSLVTGFQHPVGGLDHVLAMVAVGVWSALAGRRRVWLWPAAFVAAMLAGGIAGHLGLVLPYVEPGIAASVIVLGLLIALAMPASEAVGAALVAGFAVFHGVAHGVEAPADGWIGFAVGFAGATALLHGAGIGLGLAVARSRGMVPMRLLGVATARAGVALALR